ncbi:MAG: acetyl-CoA decarbonylase/synthase complex subunit delta [Candidatus Omnitrophica bacterium]|nr:acetyl-CoA decarbonylase/synthase complex subunit delta [Candidatus Omnitrophota bacterium]
MALELLKERWQGKIYEVIVGATKSEGGSRSHSIKLGGQTTLPLLRQEGVSPNKPQIALEIWDVAPIDWPEELVKNYKDVFSDPLAWAEKCVKTYKAQSLCIRLMGSHPDFGDKKPEAQAKLISSLLKKVSVPLIILGCGDDEKDNAVLSACCEAAKGERCLFGNAVQDNYKTLAAAVMADGHSIIAESPIDINIAKQLNILISDMGLAVEKIVINPTVGALGYGLEYTYSIMERARLSALAGDKMMGLPFICMVGQESWRAKEARASSQEFPYLGPEKDRGIIWEAMTVAALIQAGADLLVMRHPMAVEKVNKYIEELAK